LLDSKKDIIADNTTVILLGDGEFDGIDQQKKLKQLGWFYVLKTSKNTYISENLDMEQACKIADNLPGYFSKSIFIKDMYINKKLKYGLVNVATLNIKIHYIY